jgi:23S rRNA (cytidine1920-2'-O)/16S rRNA (cytidine1409-2'-O)-methyltransferase
VRSWSNRHTRVTPLHALHAYAPGVHAAVFRAARRSGANRTPGYDSAVKKRLDVLLVERGLAPTRSQAQALVLAGRVRGHTKAGDQVDEREELELVAPPRFVSRGGEKLAHALEELGVSVEGEDCLDVGASTGGFTDCLLQAGARRVIALDVGRSQLHERLRADPRVTVLERVNVRYLDCAQLPFAPTFVTCDVSFISLRAALPPALACAAPGFRALALVKPQFEASRTEVGKGVVRDPAVHRRVLAAIVAAAPSWGTGVAGIVDSGLPGPKGNREFFVYLLHGRPQPGQATLDEWIARAVG